MRSRLWEEEEVGGRGGWLHEGRDETVLSTRLSECSQSAFQLRERQTDGMDGRGLVGDDAKVFH